MHFKRLSAIRVVGDRQCAHPREFACARRGVEVHERATGFGRQIRPHLAKRSNGRSRTVTHAINVLEIQRHNFDVLVLDGAPARSYDFGANCKKRLPAAR